MKTVITQSIDGYEIIKGFDSAVLDPESTKQKAKEQLNKDENFKGILSTYLAKHKQKTDRYKTYWNKCKADPSFRTQAAYELFLHGQAELQAELVELASKIKTERDKAFNENKIFFEPKKGESTIDDEKYKSLKAACSKAGKDRLVDKWGNAVEDNRGKSYYEQVSGEWKKTEIKKLGDVKLKDSFYEHELTDQQKNEVLQSQERQRIRALTEDQRQAEINTQQKFLLREAAIKMNEMEISGELNSKDKSKQWYDDQMKMLADKYNV